MQILIVYDGNSIRAFQQDDDGLFLSSFIKVIEERLEEGNWYNGKFEVIAEDLVDKFDKLNEEYILNENFEASKFEDLYKEVKSFMFKRRLDENGDWDIVDTEN